ncbi:hypothetical protein F4782DRAFT_549547 [Xylaria castorea]|nr:hypothetical protein F4782DRAFT_549547 [Xylaria castorea]
MSELDQLKQKLKEVEEEREKERKEHQETTLKEYLSHCHLHISSSLSIADTTASSTELTTRVDCRRYPMWLRPWDKFVNLHQSHFEMINQTFGNKRLFPRLYSTQDLAETACPRAAAYEMDIALFEAVGIGTPTRKIIKKLLDANPATLPTFNFTKLTFTNNNRELKQPDNIGQTGDSARSQQVQGRGRRSGQCKGVASDQGPAANLT